MSVVMERSRFVALAVTSTTGLVLATAGYFVISSPADAAGNQLLHMMGADTTAFRSLGELIAWCSAWAVVSAVLNTASSGYLCQRHKLPREYRRQWHIRLTTCALLGSVCLQTACSGAVLASSSVVLGVSRTLLVTVQRMSTASSTAQGALLEAQQQFQQQLQQPPEGLQQALRDAKASLPVLPRPPEPIKHALDALADATLGRFVQPAVDGVQHAVAQQVTGALSASATELTRNNSALAGMVAQLEALAGDGAVRDMHGGNSDAPCAQPCLDLRQYPALHSQACICAEQAFARMRALGERIALLSTWAVIGWGLQLVCCMLSLAIVSHWLGQKGRNMVEGDPAVACTTYQRLDMESPVDTGHSETSGGPPCITGDGKPAEVELKGLKAINISAQTGS